MFTFNEAQNLCKLALGTDPHRQVMTYFAVSRSGKSYYLVSTDTHRLCVARLESSHFKVKNGETLVLNGDSKNKYPQWERVIPSQHTRSAILDADLLLSALKCLAPAYKRVSNRVILTFGEGLALSVKTEDMEVSATIPLVESDSFNGFRTAFNGNYLTDCAKAIQSIGKETKIAVQMTEADRPAIFSCTEDYREVLMPMALPN